MTDEPGRFEGRGAIVTGGASGIGRAAVERLCREGAAVFVIDIDAAALARLPKELGEDVGTYHADVGDRVALEEAMQASNAFLPNVDVLVNNAAYLSDFGSILGTSAGQWRDAIEGTLSSAFHCTKAVLPRMIERGKGSVVNIASVLGLCGLPGMSGYMSAKGGLIQLTRSIAIDYGQDGVRANAICPAAIDTANNRRATANTTDMAAIVANTVLGRLGQPTEVGAAIAFLASDEAAFITGAVLCVDGGWTLR